MHTERNIEEAKQSFSAINAECSLTGRKQSWEGNFSQASVL